MSFLDRLFNNYDRNSDPRELDEYQLKALASDLIDTKRLADASLLRNPNQIGLWQNGEQVPDYYQFKNIPVTALQDTLKWAQMSQTAPYRQYHGAEDITPSFKKAYNDALLDSINKMYEQRKRGELGGQPIQTKTGEYVYRLLFPDELVAPFAKSYNEEQKY